MITKANLEDVVVLKINGAYRGESSKAGWTTFFYARRERTNEEELTEILLLDSTNTY
jgi:hypothetical protein